MRDKTIVITGVLSAMMLSITVLSVSAWTYQDVPDDARSEPWGPRIDKLVVKKYDGIDDMFSALQHHLIDITDWPLTQQWLDTFTVGGDSSYFDVKSYGGEKGYYTLNFNHNNDLNLGSPPNPSYANPAYPNPTSRASLRQASAYLIDHALLTPGPDYYTPIYAPIPAYMGGGSPYWSSYWPYSPSVSGAAALLTADDFLMGGPGGKRYWDRNGNGVYSAGEEFNLKIYTRADELRKGAADLLVAGFDNPAIQIPYTRTEINGAQASEIIYMEKNYNIYTAGWIGIGPDPDYLYDLYHSSNYYHPGNSPNYGFIDDPELDSYLLQLKHAPDSPTALTNQDSAITRFVDIAAEVPLASFSKWMAYHRYYTGGNYMEWVTPDDGQNQYRFEEWTHIVSEKCVGLNSWYTTENAYPKGYPFGNGAMTMYYGWSELSFPVNLNPLYANWYWDWEVLGRLYDSMAGRNPYTLGPYEVEFLAHDWEVGTWNDAGETKSKVTVHLRNDIFWSDGAQFTANDVGYTFVDLPAELAAKGAPPVWWQQTISQIQSYTKINDFEIEIKMRMLSMFAVNWVLGNIIVPEHALSPFITNPTTSINDITGPWFPAPAGFPNLMTSTGPFLLQSNTAETLTMTRNPTAYNRSHRGDLNYDRLIDIFDIVKVATAFGAVPDDPNWDPKADINRDLTVDIFDITIVSTAFGWPDPAAMGWPS